MTPKKQLSSSIWASNSCKLLRKNRRRSRMRSSKAWVLLIGLLLLCLPVLAGAQEQEQKPPAQTGEGAANHAQAPKTGFPSIAPNELVRKVVDHELHARDEGSFTYRERRQTPNGSTT